MIREESESQKRERKKEMEEIIQYIEQADEIALWEIFEAFKARRDELHSDSEVLLLSLPRYDSIERERIFRYAWAMLQEGKYDEIQE